MRKIRKTRQGFSKNIEGNIKDTCLVTHETREIIRRNPIPISACEESMLRVAVFDSTHTQISSKYFLSRSPKMLLPWKKKKLMQS